MILSTHALTGAVIGKNINNIWLVILLALFFHFLMDSLRHGEYFDDRYAKLKDTWWKVGLDILIGFSIIASIFLIQDWNEKILLNVFIGIFFSLLPDGTTLLHYFNHNFFSKIKAFHSFCHCYWRYPRYSEERQWTFRNYLNDIFLSLLAIVILIFF